MRLLWKFLFLVLLYCGLISGVESTTIAQNRDGKGDGREAASDLETDVPDPNGLGERLALILWCDERHIAVADRTDLAALRILYRQQHQLAAPQDSVHPPRAIDPKRDELEQALWREHGFVPRSEMSIRELERKLAEMNEQRDSKLKGIIEEVKRKDEARDALRREVGPLVTQTGNEKAEKKPLIVGVAMASAMATAPSPPTGPIGSLLPRIDASLKLRFENGSSWYSEQVRFNRRTLVDAYRSHAKKDDPWEQAIIPVLDLAAIAFIHRPYLDSWEVELGYEITRLIDLGCDNPLMVYLHQRFPYSNRKEKINDKEARASQRKALDQARQRMIRERYPWIRIYCTALAEWECDGISKAEWPVLLDHLLSAGRSWLRAEVIDPCEREFRLRLLFPIGSDEAYGQAMLDLAGKETLTEDPWSKEMILGILDIASAWKARGNGYASTVTDQGWLDLKRYLTSAEEHFTRAWSIDPSQPLACAEMLIVAKGLQQGPEAHWTWFKRALDRNPDFEPAYRTMFDAFSTRWGGSSDELMEIGRFAFNTKRFDTEAPWFYLQAYQLAREDPRWRGRRSPAIWQEMSTLFTGYQDEPSLAKVRRWVDSAYAGIAYAFDQEKKLRILMQALDRKPIENAFIFSSRNMVKNALDQLDRADHPDQLEVDAGGN